MGAQQYHPKVVTCVNVNSDDHFVTWKCNSKHLSTKVFFGDVIISCEGYSYRDDDYVLVGSCGLEYQLNWVTADMAQGNSDSFLGFYRLHRREVLSFFGLCIIAAITLIAIVLCVGTIQTKRREEEAAQERRMLDQVEVVPQGSRTRAYGAV